jgi:hypothetical protein
MKVDFYLVYSVTYTSILHVCNLGPKPVLVLHQFVHIGM